MLVIGAFREHDVDVTHPLRGALGDIPSNLVTEIGLPPLSHEAVGLLASRDAVLMRSASTMRRAAIRST